jgi:hypothetical protein
VKNIDSDLLQQFALMLVEGARSQGLVLRVFGGIGVRLHCQSEAARLLAGREYKLDLDFVGRGTEIHKVHDFLSASRCCLAKRPHDYKGGEHRVYNYIAPTGAKVECDFYFGRLRFNHEIPGPYFDPACPHTLPVTQLLLSKLAIRKFQFKDELDTAALLACHEIGRASGPETIQVDTLAAACCTGWAGWGRAKTCLQNIAAVETGLPATLQDMHVEGGIRRKLGCLRKVLGSRKSLCWRARAIIGERRPWYDEVHPDAYPDDETPYDEACDDTTGFDSSR